MKAVLQVADCGPLESLVTMLRHVGVECFLPSPATRNLLLALGCDTVLDPVALTAGLSYDQPMSLPLCEPDQLFGMDLYFDVKAHRNGPKVWAHLPRLKERTIWYRINGGKPEITERGGDEVNPGCPVLTPNLWYEPPKNYSMWPPFVRKDEYASAFARRQDVGDAGFYRGPVALIHNVRQWGYADLVDSVVEAGVTIYGDGSPGGLVPHAVVPELLTRSQCMVHLKSNDAPGYALYEAIYAGCPLVVPRRLIRRMRMQEVLVEGESCLCWDNDGGDDHGRSPYDPAGCAAEIKSCLAQLQVPELGQRLARTARDYLESVVWRPERDAPALRDWIRGIVGCDW